MLYHITQKTTWEVSQHRLVAPSLAEEGFIHCSYRHQVVATANRHYPGKTGLVLLEIDPLALDVEVVAEDLHGAGEPFPHVYGPIPTSAVVSALDFPTSDDGTFRLPGGL